MPELPEVEVTRLSFADRIAGARVAGVRVGKALRWPLGRAPRSLVAQTVGLASRRGKYLWLPLERGGLLMHLGMSGSLAFGALPAPGPHDHFDLVTDRGTLRLTDPRRFGAVVWSPALDAGAAGEAAGAARPRAVRSGLRRRSSLRRFASPQGLGETGAARRRDRGRRRQHLRLRGAVRGAHRSPRAQRPHQPAARRRCSPRRCARRSRARSRSAARPCATFATRTAPREPSSSARVYGRAGQPCVRGDGTVRRIVQGARATFFCPGCQRR